jgi:hypothetical protein
MVTWAQLGGLMPTGLGTVGGLVGSFIVFETYAQPTCRVGTSTLTYTCMDTPLGGLNVAEFCGLGMVLGAVVGLVIGLVAEHRAAQP